MPATLLDGRRVAQEIRAEVAAEVGLLRAKGIVPGLAAVLVGEDPASAVYVKAKGAAAREAGISERTLRFPATLSEENLLRTIYELNRDESVDAILVQLPLPAQIDESRILEAIDPSKDVDGFHPVNAGKLLQKKPAPVPCTPAGIMELLARSGVDLKGKHVVVLGRSLIVGKPVALLALQKKAGANGTVTILKPAE